MNISIIIPNYNGEEILKMNLPKVLEAVKDYKKGKVEIIISDDPSVDNSEKIIQEFIGNIKEENVIGKTISNKEESKSGFSKNINRGVHLATGDILILLNSDVVPNKDFLLPLVSHFDNPDIFAVGCVDKSIENGKTVLRGIGVGQWVNGFLMHGAGDILSKNTLWASGGSSAFRISIWNRLGGINEIYNPFYWEDIDISYRAWKAGYTVLFESKSIVRHEHDQGSIKKNIKNSKIMTISYRNQFFFVWLNITDLSLILSHIAWLPVHCIRMLLSGNWLFFKGLFLALEKLPECIKYRSEYIKLLSRSDHEVLNLFKES